MKHFLFILFLGIIPITNNSFFESSINSSNMKEFRVLGYLPSSKDWIAGAEKIDFSKITDLNLAFINPDEWGNFAENEGLKFVVKKASQHHVNIYFSIGGGSPPAHLEKLLEPKHRGKFIDAICAFAQKYEFDGVDVDLENDLINENYKDFVSELSTAIQSINLKMTAALASWNADKISDETLSSYDFINIMSYDQTGPWNLNKPGQHSPLKMVEDDFAYFHQKRGIPAEKLLIGLPFYGYGFGEGAPGSMNFGNIVSKFPGSENKNEIHFPVGGTLYYNGKELIMQKTEFAMKKDAAGVMIWQLLGDSNGRHSLLKVINETKENAHATNPKW
ncbi:glycosyl hydrolase family 18 protein [Aquiflexum sp.]|uniref:glycosyl hydrolase family 18 protein n=1 Tax=Aquiflexum sp. TaxID=1872584 RepID=UPI0035930A8F